MFRLFGRGEMLECEVMDHIISFWKDNPDMKYMFESGERVLLGPFTIPVCLLSLSHILVCFLLELLFLPIK